MRGARYLAIASLILLPRLEAQEEPDVAALAAEMEARVEASLQKYIDLQEGIAEEKIPIVEKINALENQAIELRAQARSMRASEDDAREELRNRQSLTRDLRTQNDYVSGLFAQYLNTFEGRLHISEDQRFEAALTPLREAIEIAGAGSAVAREKRTEAVELCLDRLDLLSGGYTFQGRVVDKSGEILTGNIIVFGPAAYFQDESREAVGLLNFRPGALEPELVPLGDEYGQALRDYGQGADSLLPLDASLGKAISLKEAEGDWREHVEKGGKVGYAIIAMGGLALLLSLIKLMDFQSLRVSTPANLAAVASGAYSGDSDKTKQELAGSSAWMRSMLEEGAAHVREDRELMEDHMVSVILRRKPQLERFLPWLAVTAAATPLMGLLGTVVGMIKTFTLITIFGSGDPKALSSGISEALVTTELGLIVAIPTLIIHGALLRLAKRRLGAMELAATEFAKVVSKLDSRDKGGAE